MDINSASFTKIFPNARKCFNLSDKFSIPKPLFEYATFATTLSFYPEGNDKIDEVIDTRGSNCPINATEAAKISLFGEFLDGPEKLQIITNQMLASLSRSSKWKLYSAERKGSLKSACRPDYMAVAEIKNKSIEIRYLKTGRPNSSLDKQLRDYNKLNRLAKDSINETWWPKIIVSSQTSTPTADSPSQPSTPTV
ncbi:11321_t:CDS:2, partial [Dentiscutata erythropus]